MIQTKIFRLTHQMKNLGTILILLFLINSCGNSQKEATVFDPIVLKAKETSLYTDDVDWEKVNSKFIALTKGKEGLEEMKEGLQYLINSLGDKHASFRSPKDYSIIVYYTGEIKEEKPIEKDADFLNNVINDISAKFSYQLMENGIGYLKVVGIGPGDVKEQADYIRKGLTDLKAKNVEKWILDLRFNGGGNMEPMIAGLAPLIGEGNIGGTVDHQGEVMREYKIENGQFNNNGRIVCEMNNSPVIASTEKLAVLLSRYTISSGEVVAVALKGRDNTRFIGEETAGYTTGNGFDQINDELVLVISQDVFMDKNKVVYQEKVGVDDYIEFQHSIDPKDDKQMIKAMELLNQ